VQSRFLNTADAYWSWSGFLFGHGMGAHHQFLQEALWSKGKIQNLLHNDWMRIVYDYGLLGIAAACLIFIKVSQAGRVPFAIAGYTAVLFLTGNAFQYVFYWAVVSLLVMDLSTITKRPIALPKPGPAKATALRAGVAGMAPERAGS
jgi:hypothetical protein